VYAKERLHGARRGLDCLPGTVDLLAVPLITVRLIKLPATRSAAANSHAGPRTDTCNARGE